MTELANNAPELGHDQQLEQAIQLGRVMLDASTALEAVPRDIMIELAASGIRHLDRLSSVWGPASEQVKSFELEKNLRLSLLRDDELEMAFKLADQWLSDDFGA
jgi:hypothetical protein